MRLLGQPEPATRPTAKMLDFSGWRWFPSSRVRVQLHAKYQCTISPGAGKAENVRQRPRVEYPIRFQFRQANRLVDHTTHPWVYPISYPATVSPLLSHRSQIIVATTDAPNARVRSKTVEWCDRELNDPVGHREGSQREPKPELYGRQNAARRL
jgi:hypothetical protein